MTEQEFKTNLYNEIKYFRSITESEIKLKLNVELNQEKIESEQKLNDLLIKKKEYDLIPEENIEEYINQAYIIYVCKQNLTKKIEFINKSTTEKYNQEEIEEAIINVEEMNDLDKAKEKLLKESLKEFLIFLRSLVYPFELDRKNKLPMPAILLLIETIGASALYLCGNLVAKMNDTTLSMQDMQDYKQFLMVLGSMYLLTALSEFYLFLTDLIKEIKTFSTAKNNYPISVEILKELEIYEILEEEIEAKLKIKSILNKGREK